MSRINPNSSIRSGYRFEDLVVVGLCYKWLNSPKSFKSLRIQYLPDEIENKKFYLDDVVLVDNKSGYHLYQLKHKQNPSKDLWSFESFLNPGQKSESLFSKWGKSFNSLSGNRTGYFITNGIADNEFKKYLNDNKLNIAQIKSSDPELHKRISILFASKKLMASFFESFHFHFEYLQKDELETQLRSQFYNHLKVTKSGFDNLLLQIGRESAEQHPKEFTLQGIKKLLEWYNPRPLKQNFEVPQDFELFDSSKHEGLMKELHNTDGGIKIIIGKPGVGKSTYLSNLHNTLQNQNILSIRHHYHLNPKDTTYYERLSSKRAIEGLKAEFMKLPTKMLGRFANQSLQNVQLDELISAVAEYHRNLGKAYTLIIDGLDHVLREKKNEKELNSFLEEVIHPQPGIWIILGTQELAVVNFSNVIYQYAPKSNWIEIKGLTKESARALITTNFLELKLPDTPHSMNDFVNEVYAKTSGNALHLRYVLTQIKTENNVVSSNSLRKILPYNDEIANYYTELWRQLPSISKTFALAIVLFDCKLKLNDISEFGSYLTNIPSKISDSLNQIKHLLRIDISGISVYHNSFLVFIRSQVELEQQKFSLYKKSRKWLKSTKNEYLQWALQRKIEYYLNNYKPILSINREWVIQSYLQCRNIDQIIGILNVAAEAAFKIKDYSKVILYRLYSNSLSELEYNLYDATSDIWSLAFKLNAKNKLLYPDIDNLEAYQITDYIIALSNSGVIKNIPDEVFDRFNELLIDSDRTRYDDVVPQWIELIAHFENDISVKSVHKFIGQFKDSNNSGKYYAKYLKSLIRLGKTERARKILDHQFTSSELESIVDMLVKYNLENSTSYFEDFIKHKSTNSERSILQFYSLLKENVVPNTRALPEYTDFPNDVDYYGTSRSYELLNIYFENFFNGVALYLKGEDKKIEKWCIGATDRWPHTMMCQLFKASKLFAEAIKTNDKIIYGSIIDVFESIRMLDFREDHEIYELRRFVLPECIIKILEFGLFHNKVNKHEFKYSEDDVIRIMASKWLYNSSLISHLFTFNQPPISAKGLNELIERRISDFETDISPFRDKAETVISLAHISYNCNNTKQARRLLNIASENIISYGYHKDMYLYSVLKGIDICAKSGSAKTLHFLKEVAPYVHYIRDFTDGDETGGFIYDLAELYGKYNPQLLYKLYLKSIEEQDYYKSESFFADIVSILNLPNTVNNAILNTCIDSNSYNALTFRAKTDGNARTILKSIQSTFGKIDYTEHYSDSSKYKSRKEKKGNYSNVLPANLAKHLNKIHVERYASKEYVQRNYLKKWLEYWLENNYNSRYEVYWAVKSIILPQLEEIDEEVYSKLYPIAKTVDIDFAFECLLWGHSNNSIWGSTWHRSLDESRKMWKKAIDDFPDRLEEYFEKTILYTGMRYNRGGEYFIPVPKSLAFFIDCNNLEKAEQILQFAISHLKELIPNIKLPVLKYLNDTTIHDEFDILLQRLTWVNPIVRERSALGLSRVMQQDDNGFYHKKLLEWFSNQKLESIVTYGLIVILESLENSKSASYKRLNPKVLRESISVYSTTIEILLKLIFLKTEKLFSPNSFDSDFNLTIPEVKELEKFKKNIGHHIQLAFTDTCQQLEDQTNFNVFNLWAHIFETKKKEIGLIEGRHIDDFCNSKREYMIGRTTIVSDLLRSSFMKTLDYLFQKGFIDFQRLLFEAYRSVPIDMSMWKLKLSKQPKWWPSFNISKEESKGIILSTNIIQPIENILTPEPGWRILHLSGAINPKINFYESTLHGHIEIVPFAYKVLGSKMPSTKDIYRIAANFGSYFPAGGYLDDFNIFNNEMSFNSNNSFPISLKDVLIFPLTAGVTTLSSNIWQLYRMYSGLELPIPHISMGLSLETKNGKLSLKNSDGDNIYIANDFLFGLRDRFAYKLLMPYGRYLLVKEEFLNNIMKHQNVSLAYVCKITYKTQKHRYSEEFEESTFYDLINFSSLIRP